MNKFSLIFFFGLIVGCPKATETTAPLNFTISATQPAFKIDLESVKGLPTDLIDFCGFDEIQFTAQIQNPSSHAVTISLYGLGTTAVASFTRNGQELMGQVRSVNFHSLELIRVGGHLG